MKILTTTLTLATIGAAGYTAMFFYEPARQASEPVREAIGDTVTTAVQHIPTPELSPLEQARQELTKATERLNNEEARLLGEIDNATTTAAAAIADLNAQIAAIEEQRDNDVARLEADIEEINETRASF